MLCRTRTRMLSLSLLLTLVVPPCAVRVRAEPRVRAKAADNSDVLKELGLDIDTEGTDKQTNLIWEIASLWFFFGEAKKKKEKLERVRRP